MATLSILFYNFYKKKVYARQTKMSIGYLQQENIIVWSMLGLF